MKFQKTQVINIIVYPPRKGVAGIEVVSRFDSLSTKMLLQESIKQIDIKMNFDEEKE